MKRCCPNPECHSDQVIKSGFYHRPSDGRNIQRFQCLSCSKKFSAATGTPAFGQNKRRVNNSLLKLLSSGVSQNRAAMLLNVNRKTVARKLPIIAKQCARKNAALLAARKPSSDIQFDELETFEHTKCKPLSVALAVENDSRIILGFAVSSMPANGLLARISRAKYGERRDDRRKGLLSLMSRIQARCNTKFHLLSDKCPRYQGIVKAAFQKVSEIIVTYEQTKGARGCIGGQGELKKLVFDPLFSLNHTCAMLRANINRLFRRTWCSTKKAICLQYHLEIYTYFHNKFLIPS